MLNCVQKITSKVELKDNATAPVHIRYFSKCKGGPEVETSVCDNLHVGDQVRECSLCFYIDRLTLMNFIDIFNAI